MKGILDRVAAQRHSHFHPQSAIEYVALRLAQKLGEPAAAQHYLMLIDQHSEERVLAAYRRAVGKTTEPGSLPREFHTALERTKTNGGMSDQILMAIKVERRSVAVAIFNGTQLDYTQVRQLCTNLEKVDTSAVGFLNLMFSHFKIESVALEVLPPTAGEQRLAVNRIIEAALASRTLPVSQVEKQNLVSSFAHPAPSSRSDMRAIVRGIWPVLGSDEGIIDAVALGLYSQVERLFSHTA